MSPGTRETLKGALIGVKLKAIVSAGPNTEPKLKCVGLCRLTTPDPMSA